MANHLARYRSARYVREAARRARAVDALCAALGAVMLTVMLVYMFVGDRPFNPSLAAASEISPVNRWVWMGLMALAVPVFWMRRGALLPLAARIWPVLVLYAWFVVTTAWALDPAASSRRVLQSCFALAACIAINLGLRRPERLHWVVCVPALLVMVVDLASWFVVPGIAMTPLGLQGMHGQKNVLGAFSMFTLLAVMTCVFGRLPRLGRVLLAGGAGVTLAALIASRSGTSAGLVGAAAVVLPCLVFLLRRRAATTATALIMMLTAVVAGLAFYLMECGLGGADPLAPLAGVTFTRRTDLWAFLIQNIHQRPWGGAGFGSFWAIDPAVQPSIRSGLWFGRKGNIAPEGHDAFLDLAATTGLVGATLGLFLLVRAIHHTAAAVRAAPRGVALPTAAFALGLTLIVIGHSFTESTLFGANSPLNVLFLLFLIGIEQARDVGRAGNEVRFAARRRRRFDGAPGAAELAPRALSQEAQQRAFHAVMHREARRQRDGEK